MLFVLDDLNHDRVLRGCAGGATLCQRRVAQSLRAPVSKAAGWCVLSAAGGHDRP